MVHSPNLRITSERLRFALLSGTLLVLATSIYSLLRYPKILLPLSIGIFFLSVFGITCVAYTALALRVMRFTSVQESITIRLGQQWGLIVGMLWIIELVAGNILNPHQSWVLVAYFGTTCLAYLVPILAGFLGARQSGLVVTGAQIGALTGMISGLITFLVLMAITYLQILVPAFPYYHNSADYQQFLTSKTPDFATFTIGDALAGGTVHLLVIGLLLGSLTGLLGGAIGAGFGPKAK